MDVFQTLGIKKQKKADFPQLLFYFMREFKQNPLPEEYEAIPIYEEKKFLFFKWKKIIMWRITKKGMNMPTMTSLIKEMGKHYEKEKAEINKARRR